MWVVLVVLVVMLMVHELLWRHTWNKRHLHGDGAVSMPARATEPVDITA